MRRRSLVVVLALLGAVLVWLAPTARAAATRVVDDDMLAAADNCNALDEAHPTISDAVDAAEPGDVIKVCPGVYAEEVTVTKSLRLEGPNAGISALDPRTLEAFVLSSATAFSISASDVTIDGFQVRGDFGIYVVPSSDVPVISNNAVRNNIVTGTTRALSYDGPGNGFVASGNHLTSDSRQLHIHGDFSDVRIDGNRFSGSADTGIFYSAGVYDEDGQLTPFSIDGYQFTSNAVNGGLANMAARISDGEVSGNSSAVTTGGLNLQANLHDSTVQDNIFEGDGTVACLQLFGNQFGLDPSTNVVVAENRFSDCARYGLQLSEGIDDIMISNNDFENAQGDGINTRLMADEGPWTLNTDIHINRNSITGSTGFGVNNTVGGLLDAECNWWGSASGPGAVGPGTGDRVSAGVDFTPWLTTTPDQAGDCGTNPPPNKQACKNGGWMAYTDDQGRRFKNEGDCVSFVSKRK